jgi:hypothetical protein
VDPYKRLYKTAISISTLIVALLVGCLNYEAFQIYGERVAAALNGAIDTWFPTSSHKGLIQFWIFVGADAIIALMFGSFFAKLIIENGFLRRIILRKEYCEGYWAKFPSATNLSIYDPHFRKEANTRQPTVLNIAPNFADVQIHWTQYDEHGRRIGQGLARDINVTWPVLQGRMSMPVNGDVEAFDFTIEFDWVSPKKAVLRYSMRSEPFYIPLERASRRQGKLMPVSR